MNKRRALFQPLFWSMMGSFLLCFPAGLHAAEWSGRVGVEGRLFLNDPIHPGQREQQASIIAQPEYYQSWEESSFTAVPFFRLDSADSERTHFDVREFFFLWYPGSFDLGVGVRKIFWGVTESQHLVDIVNQTDLVELTDGEEKLGQPMLHFSVLQDWGTLDFFVLPYFRERTFPGRKGRLRTALVVDTDQARFESGAKKHHVDIALRYAHTLGDWDIALSHFEGTGREPTFLIGSDVAGNPVLIPFYEQIGQTGLELQHVAEAWLWKLEVIHRNGQGEAFEAATFGFEYTFTGLFETRMDLGAIGEWLYDTRGTRATTPFENDLMFGLRLAVNDMASTELLIGVIQDLNHAEKLLSIEGARRITDHWKMEVEGNLFMQQNRNALFYDLREDDFLQFSLSYYF